MQGPTGDRLPDSIGADADGDASTILKLQLRSESGLWPESHG